MTPYPALGPKDTQGHEQRSNLHWFGAHPPRRSAELGGAGAHLAGHHAGPALPGAVGVRYAPVLAHAAEVKVAVASKWSAR